MSIALAIGSVLLVGPTFGFFQGYREKLELQKYGVWTKSVVVDRKHSVVRHGSWNWLLKSKYEAGGKAYETHYHDDIDNIHPMGDTIMIIYSSRFPKIYTFRNEWEK